MRQIIVGISVAAISLGSYLVGATYGHAPRAKADVVRVSEGGSTESDSEQPPARDVQVVTVQRQVVALSEELKALRNEFARKSVSAERRTDSVSRLKSGSGRDPEGIRGAEQERHARMASVEGAFLNEPRDPIWSSNMASTIRDAAKTDDTMRRVLGNVDCRSRTCRVELAEDAVGGVGQNVALFLMNLGSAAGSTVTDRVEQTNGSKTTILYVSRPADRQPQGQSLGRD